MVPTQLAVHEAVFFVTRLGADGPPHTAALDAALQRMAVTASRRQIVALAETPELGARWNVRVAPCLVLETGTRQVQLPGELAGLNAARLEQALSQQ